jgi:hypothetical protein
MLVPNCDPTRENLVTLFAAIQSEEDTVREYGGMNEVCADNVPQTGALRLQTMKMKRLCGIKNCGCMSILTSSEFSNTVVVVRILNEYSKWWGPSSLVSIVLGI